MLEFSLFCRETKFLVAVALAAFELSSCQTRQAPSEVFSPVSVEVVVERTETEDMSNSSNLEVLADRLRQLYFAHEYPACVESGQELHQRGGHTESYRALGWWYLCRNQIEAVSRIVAEAQIQSRAHLNTNVELPHGPEKLARFDDQEIKQWSNFMQAAAWLGDRRYGKHLQEQLQSLAASASHHPDVEWIYAYALGQLYAVDEAMPKIESIVDAAVASGRETAQLLIILARMKAFQMVVETGNEAAGKRSLELYERAVEIDPQMIDAYLEPIEVVRRLKDDTFDKNWLERAEAIAPESFVVKVARWEDLLKRAKLVQDPKIAMIVSEIEQYLANIKGSNTESLSTARRKAERGRTLFQVAKIYDRLGRENERDRLHSLILEQFPHSKESERIVFNRVFSLKVLQQEESASRDPKKRQGSKEQLRIHQKQIDRIHAYQKELRDYLDRSVHYDLDKLAYVYAELLLSYGKYHLADLVEPAYLLDLAKGAIRNHGTMNWRFLFAKVPIFLAEHTPYRAEARLIAKQGLQRLSELQAVIGGGFYRASDVDDRIRVFRSVMHDAIGWINFKEGRMEEAQSSLARALEIDPRFLQAIIHLAKVEEQCGMPKEAEKRLLRSIEAGIVGAEHESQHALKQLYLSRKGTPSGFDAYLRKARDKFRRQKKREVLASRRVKQEALPPLELVDIQGNPFAHPDLSKKITVVHFWGMW